MPLNSQKCQQIEIQILALYNRESVGPLALENNRAIKTYAMFIKFRILFFGFLNVLIKFRILKLHLNQILIKSAVTAIIVGYRYLYKVSSLPPK